jgi:hypothetical protein
LWYISHDSRADVSKTTTLITYSNVVTKRLSPLRFNEPLLTNLIE